MTVTSTEIGAPARGGHGGGPTAGPGALARLRRDQPWWLLPATVVAVLGGFIVYSAWTAHLGVARAEQAPYLSPFYSPEWITGRVPFFPALLALIVPIAFRGTCYYYRKAYHRSFFWDPPACGVGELRHREYHGESRLPLILNNLHRFAFYLAAVYIVILGYDAVEAFHFGGRWYIGIGTGIMVVNVVLLAGYTFSCHSFRHLVGGGLDCYSCVRFGRQRHGIWRVVTRMNHDHPTWAWISMFSVWGVDIYIRLLNHSFFLDPHVVF